VALVLQMVQYLELLCEMAAKRRGGERMRWRVVVAVELAKAACRLLLLRLTNSRPLLSPPLPQREIDPALLEEFNDGVSNNNAESGGGSRKRRYKKGGDDVLPPSSSLPTLAANFPYRTQALHDTHDGGDGSDRRRRPAADAGHSGDDYGDNAALDDGVVDDYNDDDDDNDTARRNWFMPRTGLTLPALPAATDVTGFLLSRVLTAEDVRPPTTLLHRMAPGGPAYLAEILYILRPLIYALAMQRWSKKQQQRQQQYQQRYQQYQQQWQQYPYWRRPPSPPPPSHTHKPSWTPWLLGLAIEYGARQLAQCDWRARRAGGLARGLTALERDALLTRRGWELGWWALRGAFYHHITKYVMCVSFAFSCRPSSALCHPFILLVLLPLLLLAFARFPTALSASFSFLYLPFSSLPLSRRLTFSISFLYFFFLLLLEKEIL
jgi:peroxin-16